MPASGTGKRGKRADKRPARSRYWSSHALERHKVSNILRCNKPWRRPPAEGQDGVRMTREQVADLWKKAREGRRMR